MINILKSLLNDHVTEGIMSFRIFHGWHILYLVLILGSIIAFSFILKNKSEKVKNLAIAITINTAFTLYMLDFFLMPFAYGYIGIDKLPFHICTLSCLLCFACRHNKFLAKFKTQFIMLGLIGNLIYIHYPAVLDQYNVHAFSYRAVQTLLFHGAMAAHGIFSLVFGNIKLEWKYCYKEAIAICLLVVWSLLGNMLYSNIASEFKSNFIHPGNVMNDNLRQLINDVVSGTINITPEISNTITEALKEETYFFNWFFVIKDPFNVLSISISPYIMPFVMLFTIFLANILIYSAYYGIRALSRVISKKRTA